mgnify:CR=1 FL=1
MKLTTKKLYQLIKEAMERDPDPVYAALYDPNKPLALLHMEDGELQTFILYHLTNSPQNPVFVVSYINMELMEEQPCIPIKFSVYTRKLLRSEKVFLELCTIWLFILLIGWAMV